MGRSASSGCGLAWSSRYAPHSSSVDVDITGEQAYLKRIFDTYSVEAEGAGVTVVPAMTDDGLPGDLIASLTAARIGDADDVTIADLRIPAGASRGTARMALSNAEELKSGGLTYDDGEWTTGTQARLASITPPGDQDPIPVVKFPLPGVVTVPRHVTARHVEGVIRSEVAAVFTSVTAEFVDSLPEGPAEEARRAGSWLMMAQAISTSTGRRARGAVRGTDGYGVTAAIAAEGARRLASGGAKPGVLAPAQAFDATGFLETLAPYGVRWHIDVDQLDS